MAKKKFGAAKYTDLPEEHYLVVINPWGMVSGRPRGMRDAQCCAAWLRGVFGVEIEGLVEAIFMMDTRDEVIVRLAPEADHELGLGVHKPEKFLEPVYLEAVRNNQAMQKYRHIFRPEYLASMNPRTVLNPSYIFEYNWAMHGDPLRKQWKAVYPPQDAPPKEFPVKIPYPDSSWSSFPPQASDPRLSSLLLPLPAGRERTPTPSPPTPPPRPAPEPDTSLFTPYAPPAHHPSHARSHYAAPGNQQSQEASLVKEDNDEQSGDIPTRTGVVPQVKSEPSKADKLDPYEQDEAANRGLGNQNAPAKKEEPSESEDASRALLGAFNEYSVRHSSERASSSHTPEARNIKSEMGADVKPDIKPDIGAAPSILQNAYAEYLQSTQSPLIESQHADIRSGGDASTGSKRKTQNEDHHRGFKRAKDESSH